MMNHRLTIVAFFCVTAMIKGLNLQLDILMRHRMPGEGRVYIWSYYGPVQIF